MDQVYYTDEVYRAHDGVRDRFDWARFSNPRFLSIGLFLALTLILVAGQNREAKLRGVSVEVAGHVVAESVRAVRALALDPRVAGRE